MSEKESNSIFDANDLDDLDIVRAKRREIVDVLSPEPKDIPDNTRKLELLMGTLTDLEDSAIKRAKLKLTADRDDGEDTLAKAIVSRLLMSDTSNVSKPKIVQVEDIPALPPEIEESFDIPRYELDEVSTIIRPEDLDPVDIPVPLEEEEDE